MTRRQQTNIFRKLYYGADQPTSFAGLNAVTRAAQKIQNNIKLPRVKDFFTGERTYVLHKPVRRKFERSKVFAEGKNALWEADLAEMQNQKGSNDNTRYLLTVIDVFSKVAFVEPIKTKNATDVSAAFERILDKARPNKLRTDNGTEFKNKYFKQLMHDHGIHHYFTNEGDVKAAVVERFNRTLKGRLYKLMTWRKSKRYIDDLQRIVSAYNRSIHRSIGMSPLSVTSKNAALVAKRLYGQGRQKTKAHRPKFKIGQTVLIAKEHTIHDKGYSENWQRELFKVVHRIPHYPYRYRIADRNGEELVGTFYEPEMQEIDKKLLV